MNTESTCCYCDQKIVFEDGQWFALDAHDSEVCYRELFVVGNGTMVGDVRHTDDPDPRRD
jgi:hypothetical protein